MSVAALVISAVALVAAVGSLVFTMKSNTRDSDRRRDERTPRIETKFDERRVWFRTMGGAELDAVSVYLTSRSFADSEAANVVGDWVDLRHDSANLAHPLDHGRWCPLPAISDPGGSVTFVLHCENGSDRWDVPLTVDVPDSFVY